MMVGFVVTVNPVTSQTTYSGITQNFELDIKGEEIGTSSFTLPNFTGAAHDVLAMRIVDGSGYLKPETRVSGKRPAFYYGVVTAVDKDTAVSDEDNSSEQLSAVVQCSDHKTYVDSSFIPETTTTKKSPMAFLKAIYDRWLIQDNQNGIPMKCLSSTVEYHGPAFNYPSPTEAGTDELMTLFGRSFSNYQIPLVVVDDNINSGNQLLLSCMFICGVDVGTVVIDDSVLVRGANVTERPAGDNEHNAIAIGKPKYKTTTKKVKKKVKKKKKTVKKKVKTYISVTKYMRYRENPTNDTDGNIVKTITSKVRTPVKIKAYVKTDKTKYDKIAKDNLTLTRYSHEITFGISVYHPAILNGLAEIGNKVTLLHKGKTYVSYVSSVKITSDSEFIEITCGNSKGKKGLASLIDTNSKKVAGKSGSEGSTDTEVTSSASLATEADIDAFF